MASSGVAVTMTTVPMTEEHIDAFTHQVRLCLVRLEDVAGPPLTSPWHRGKRRRRPPLGRSAWQWQPSRRSATGGWWDSSGGGRGARATLAGGDGRHGESAAMYRSVMFIGSSTQQAGMSFGGEHAQQQPCPPHRRSCLPLRHSELAPSSPPVAAASRCLPRPRPLPLSSAPLPPLSCLPR